MWTNCWNITDMHKPACVHSILRSIGQIHSWACGCHDSIVGGNNGAVYWRKKSFFWVISDHRFGKAFEFLMFKGDKMIKICIPFKSGVSLKRSVLLQIWFLLCCVLFTTFSMGFLLLVLRRLSIVTKIKAAFSCNTKRPKGFLQAGTEDEIYVTGALWISQRSSQPWCESLLKLIRTQRQTYCMTN